jgi:hypothetical protein
MEKSKRNGAYLGMVELSCIHMISESYFGRLCLEIVATAKSQ